MRKRHLRAAGVGWTLILAACSLTDPEGDDLSVSGEAPAAADAVFQKAEAFLQRSTYQVIERVSPTLIRARRSLPGQDRTGRLDFTTSAGATAATTKYQILVWTEILGVQARENDAAMAADATSLSAALTCPAAKWPSCP